MSSTALCVVLWPHGPAPTMILALKFAPPRLRTRRAPVSLRVPALSLGLGEIPSALRMVLADGDGSAAPSDGSA